MRALRLLLFPVFVSNVLCGAVITQGIDFTVADAGAGFGTTGTHFHQGFPSIRAEVGRTEEVLFAEELRGLAEFNLAGLATTGSVFVTFDVAQLVGPPVIFGISVNSYHGNNLAELSDFEAPSTGGAGSFSAAELVVGDVRSIPITALFNAAISGANDSLGIRLAMSVPFGCSPSGCGALNTGSSIVFDNFRLTTDDQTTPEPSTAVLLAVGLAGLLVLRRRALPLASVMMCQMSADGRKITFLL